MKKIILVLLALALILCGISCKQEKDNNLKIGVMPSENILPIIYAKESGIFEKYGLNVDVTIFRSAVDRDTAFQTGELDGVATDMLSVIFLNDAGFDIKITTEDITNFKVISVVDDGKTIGVSKNTVIEYVAEKYIENTDKEYEIIYVPAVPVRLELLNTKELDMAVLPEPLASVPMDAKVLAYSNDMNLFPGVHAFNADALEAKDIKAFYMAYNEAVDIINSSSVDEFKGILTDSIGFSEDMFDGYTLPKYNKAKKSNEADFKSVMQWMNDKGYSKSEYSLGDVSDFSFIK
ncbi:MAG: ABC transporter substrate-binding protein [Eubacteriales bacterium]